MKKYIFLTALLVLPITAFCQSSLQCREFDVNNTIMQLQSRGYHIISVRNQTPNASPSNAIWIIIYE